MNRTSWTSSKPGPIRLGDGKPSDAADVSVGKVHAVPKAALEEGIIQLLASAAEMQQRQDFDSALQLYTAAMDKVKAHNLNRKRLFTGTAKKPPPLNSRTPIQWCLHVGDIASAICLLGSPNAALAELRTTVLIAQVEQVLDAGASIEYRIGPKGRTLLLQEAAEARLAGVRLALDRGAGVEVMDDNGDTALALALPSQKPDAYEIINDLIEAGSGINSRDGQGQELWKLAIAQGQLIVVNQVIARLSPLGAEHREYMNAWAATLPAQSEKWSDRTCEVLRTLLDHGLDANVSLQSPSGKCNLLEAVVQRKGSTGEHLVADLLDHGAGINLEVILRAGSTKTIETILRRSTPFHDVQLRQISAWIKTLHLDPKKWSPNNVEILKLLLVHGFDPNFRRSETPHSPLIVCAAKAGDLDFLQRLVKQKAQLNVADDNSETALVCAAKASNRPIYDALKKAGVNDGIFFGLSTVWNSHHN